MTLKGEPHPWLGVQWRSSFRPAVCSRPNQLAVVFRCNRRIFSILVCLSRWITIEHRWFSALHCQGPTPTPGAPPNYLKVKAKQAIPQEATSTHLGTTKPLCTTSPPYRPAHSTSPPLLTWALSASHPAPTPHPAGAPPQTSSPLGCPTNSFGLPCSWWSAQETPESTWTTLSKSGKGRPASCASPPRNTQGNKLQWRKWTFESSRDESCFLMR